MQGAEDADEIDQPMKLYPAPAQATLHGVGGGHGQGNHQHQRQKPDGDVGPHGDIHQQRAPGESLVQHGVGDGMQENVDKCRQTQGTPQRHQPVEPGLLSDRGDRQRQDQEIQTRLAEGVQHHLYRVRTQVTESERTRGYPGERYCAGNLDQRLDQRQGTSRHRLPPGRVNFFALGAKAAGADETGEGSDRTRPP